MKVEFSEVDAGKAVLIENAETGVFYRSTSKSFDGVYLCVPFPNSSGKFMLNVTTGGRSFLSSPTLRFVRLPEGFTATFTQEKE